MTDRFTPDNAMAKNNAAMEPEVQRIIALARHECTQAQFDGDVVPSFIVNVDGYKKDGPALLKAVKQLRADGWKVEVEDNDDWYADDPYNRPDSETAHLTLSKADPEENAKGDVARMPARCEATLGTIPWTTGRVHPLPSLTEAEIPGAVAPPNPQAKARHHPGHSKTWVLLRLSPGNFNKGSHQCSFAKEERRMCKSIKERCAQFLDQCINIIEWVSRIRG